MATSLSSLCCVRQCRPQSLYSSSGVARHSRRHLNSIRSGKQPHRLRKTSAEVSPPEGGDTQNPELCTIPCLKRPAEKRIGRTHLCNPNYPSHGCSPQVCCLKKPLRLLKHLMSRFYCLRCPVFFMQTASCTRASSTGVELVYHGPSLCLLL